MDSRKVMRQKRQNLSLAEKELAARQLYENFLKLNFSFESIAAYIAFDGEIDPKYIIEWAWKNHKTVYLPVLTNTKIMKFAEYNIHTELKLNKFNILEPQNTKIISAENVDLILLPLVAFDKNCHRLGMGQGFYDATFKNKNKTFLLGLAYDFQEVNQIIPHGLDVRLDRVITDKK